MKNRTKMICIIGGFYFIVGYIIDLLRSFFQDMQVSNEMIVSCFDCLSAVFIFSFIILFFACFFKQRGILFIQKFMDRYPKVSLYMYYIGFVGYVMFVIDILILIPTEFMIFDETEQKYIGWSLAAINITGTIIALSIASIKVFFRHGNKSISN